VHIERLRARKARATSLGLAWLLLVLAALLLAPQASASSPANPVDQAAGAIQLTQQLTGSSQQSASAALAASQAAAANAVSSAQLAASNAAAGARAAADESLTQARTAIAAAGGQSSSGGAGVPPSGGGSSSGGVPSPVDGSSPGGATEGSPSSTPAGAPNGSSGSGDAVQVGLGSQPVASLNAATDLPSVPAAGGLPASITDESLSTLASVSSVISRGTETAFEESPGHLRAPHRLNTSRSVWTRDGAAGLPTAARPGAGGATIVDWQVTAPHSGTASMVPGSRWRSPARPRAPRHNNAAAVNVGVPYVAPLPPISLGSGEGGAAGAGAGGGGTGAGPAAAVLAAVGLSLLLVLSSRRLSLDLLPLISRLAASPLERPG
jgi:hypothetical protein